jgi:putative MATE family efflux protein
MGEFVTSSIIRTRSQALIEFFNDKEYYQRLFSTALPIALQQLFMSSLNMVGVVMIGQLGDAPVAAVGLANQVFFLLNILVFGITSGSAMFTAQLWGRRDVPTIRKVLGIALTLGLLVGALFFVIAVFFSTQALGIYSRDPIVISLGSDYLSIIGYSFIFFTISFCYSAVLRSTGDVKTPLFVTITALSLNTLLSYALIFGKFGLPVLGVRGAAYAVLASRVVECSLLLTLTYRKKSPAAGRLKEIFSYDLPFIRKVLKPVLPVVANETLWSTGITAYNIVYARLGTDSIAAMNIASSIENLAFVFFIGLGNACAILVGHRIGEGDEEKAFIYAARTLLIGLLFGLIIGSIILLSAASILTLYNVSPLVLDYADHVLTIIGLLIWLRATNMILFIGVFRSGGDTRFAFLLDGVIIWVLGVPLAYVGGFIFHLPVYWVYLMVMSEELSKWLLGLYRFFSRKWIHNLSHHVAG